MTDYEADLMIAHAEIATLKRQLAESQRRAQDARNELCLKCGKYKMAHYGACDGCRCKGEK